MFLLILIGSLVMFGRQGQPTEFRDANEALSALDRMSEGDRFGVDVKAYRYFTGHPDESIPLLIDFTLTHKHRYYVGVRALSKIKNERVITFLIDLADAELYNVANSPGNSCNPYCYSPEDLIALLIVELGNYGDERAIPVIEKSLSRLNDSHRDSDMEALCKLGKISIDELHEWHKESAENLQQIASSNRYTNPKFSVDMCDWIIKRFPQRQELLKDRHISKILALYNAREYALALGECETIRQSSDGNPAAEISFTIDRRRRALSEMIELLKAKIGAGGR
jgi:hypothetical protein